MWIRGRSNVRFYVPPDLLYMLGKMIIWGTVCVESKCQGYWNFCLHFLNCDIDINTLLYRERETS